MVAAPFVNPSVVNLPSVAKAGQQKETPVRVVVRPNGRISSSMPMRRASGGDRAIGRRGARAQGGKSATRW